MGNCSPCSRIRQTQRELGEPLWQKQVGKDFILGNQYDPDSNRDFRVWDRDGRHPCEVVEMTYFFIGLGVYCAIGLCLLIKGSMKYGSPDGATVLMLLAAWPFYIKDVF